METITIKGNIITPFKIINNGQISVNKGKITYVGEESQTYGKVIDFGSNIISPGFIDIHIHGALGYDTMKPSIEAFNKISLYLAKGGVTGFLPTTYSTSHKELLEILRELEKVWRHGLHGAQLLGVHLEGPYINYDKRGAQNPSAIRKPDLIEMKEIVVRYGDLVKIVTLAPELEGATEVIQYLNRKNIVVSAGHTNAKYNETITSIETGLTHGTHLFNGMRSFHHREPGVTGALLTDSRVTVELIADGFHLHPAVLKLVVRVKGVENTVLVSDCIKPGGLPNGEYMVSDSKVKMIDGTCLLPDGTIAGSTIKLDQAVKLMKKTGFALGEVIQMASSNPARILGFDMKGRLEKGCDADIVVFDEEHNIMLTMVQGRIVYEA